MTRSKMIAVGVSVAVLAVLAAVLLVTGGLPGLGPAPWNTLTRQVADTRMLVGSLRTTFEQGRLVDPPPPGARDPRPDARFVIVNAKIDKLRYQISRKESDVGKRQAALASVAEAQKVIAEFAPKYGQAMDRNDLKAAKGFVDYMVALDTHLDGLLKILKG